MGPAWGRQSTGSYKGGSGSTMGPGGGVGAEAGLTGVSTALGRGPRRLLDPECGARGSRAVSELPDLCLSKGILSPSLSLRGGAQPPRASYKLPRASVPSARLSHKLPSISDTA